MTRDEILNMEAGRKIDAMIYQFVFKNRVEFLTSKLDPDYMEYLIPSDDTNYSTSIVDAWKVVEKLDFDWDVEISTGRYFSGYPGQTFGCRISNKHILRVIFCLGSTAPLAICRAALLAVMENK